MHEYYKMGRICAVTMGIAESVSFLRGRHDNLLQEPDDRINILSAATAGNSNMVEI